MSRATVKWFNIKKGFGFIVDGGDKEIFVHYSAIATEGFRWLDEGDEVECEVMDGPKGRHAVNVRPLRRAGKTAPKLALPDPAGGAI